MLDVAAAAREVFNAVLLSEQPARGTAGVALGGALAYDYSRGRRRQSVEITGRIEA